MQDDRCRRSGNLHPSWREADGNAGDPPRPPRAARAGKMILQLLQGKQPGAGARIDGKNGSVAAILASGTGCPFFPGSATAQRIATINPMMRYGSGACGLSADEPVILNCSPGQ
jgi:hypothetical protein